MSFLDLDTEQVRHVDISSQLLCLGPETSVREVLCQMKEARQGCALILQDRRLAGIFTERDALKIMAHGHNLEQTIGKVMTAQPVTIRASDTVGHAIRLMSEGGYRHLPIVDVTESPVGILKVSHILHYLVQHFPQFIYNLPPTPYDQVQEREGA